MDTIPLLVRLVLALAIVLGLIFGSVWMLRRWAPGRFSRTAALPVPLEVVGQTWLGPRRSVTAVRVADRLLLLGVTQTSIVYLSEIQHAFPDGTIPAAALPTLSTPAAAVLAPRPGSTGAATRRETPVAGGFGAELADILGGMSRSRARLTGEDLR